MKELYLFGAGEHAKVIIDILKESGSKIIKVFDDNQLLDDFLGIPISHDKVSEPIIISIGDNKNRRNIYGRLGENIIYSKAISKKAIISDSATILDGSVVMSGAVIQSFAKIGTHVIVNTSSSIDHDCVIHDFAHIAPGATLCGGITIGEGTMIGAGTVITPGVKIGSWSVIGAGSVVTRDIPDNVLAFGVPCRIIKQIKAG